MPQSSKPSSWKENIGFPAVGSGLIIIVISLYDWMEGYASLTSFEHERLASFLVGGSLIGFGLLLTWPRSK